MLVWGWLFFVVEGASQGQWPYNILASLWNLVSPTTGQALVCCYVLNPEMPSRSFYIITGQIHFVWQIWNFTNYDSSLKLWQKESYKHLGKAILRDSPTKWFPIWCGSAAKSFLIWRKMSLQIIPYLARPYNPIINPVWIYNKTQVESVQLGNCLRFKPLNFQFPPRDRVKCGGGKGVDHS